MLETDDYMKAWVRELLEENAELRRDASLVSVVTREAKEYDDIKASRDYWANRAGQLLEELHAHDKAKENAALRGEPLTPYNSKVMFIKLVRDIFGTGLTDSKDLVDELYEKAMKLRPPKF